jgi:hypothetical protein
VIRFMNRTAATLAAVSLTITMAMVEAHDREHLSTPEVPANLVVEAGHRAFLIAHALGTQNYMCLPAGSGLAWTPVGPQATLFDEDGRQLTTHFLSLNPLESGVARATWQHSRDTSAAWAMAIQQSTDAKFVKPGAIPWLLLKVVGAQDGTTGDKLAKTTFIQRVNTVGGPAPTTPCVKPGARAFVFYEADYVFWRRLPSATAAAAF